MKFSKITAALLSAVMTVSYCSFTAFAEEETEHTIIFDCFTDDITFGKKTDPTSFETYKTQKNYVSIPDGTLVRDGYTFQGWTVDGYWGYKAGDIYNVPDDADEVKFEPVFMDNNSEDYHEVILNIDKEVNAIPKTMKGFKSVAGRIVALDMSKLESGKEFSRGWTDGEHHISENQKFIMPDHDVTLTPMWYKIITITYTVGDVDRVNGMREFTTERNEGSDTDLSDNTRFSRNGFNLTGWLNSYDGVIYKTGALYKNIPGEDITFTAVWTPKTYNVVFKQSNGQNIKIAGETDTAIVCPEPTETKEGLVFDGWLASDNKKYKAGEEYIIPGAIPGSGIVLTAQWTEKKEESNIMGDANSDGEVTAADAVTILQFLGNKDKYDLSEHARELADVYNHGDGVTALDALEIQKLDAGVITEFSISK